MNRRLKFWLIALAICVIVIVPAVMVLRSWMNSDSSGTVKVGRPVSPTAAPDAQPVDITNAWFAANLPAGFTIKRQQNNPQDPTEQYGVDALTGDGTQTEMTIAYGPMPAGLNGLSAYQLRATHTSDYTPYTLPGMPAGSVAYRDLNNPYSSAAFVVFWPHGGSCATIALTGGLGATLGQLNTNFGQLIASWKWK